MKRLSGVRLCLAGIPVALALLTVLRQLTSPGCAAFDAVDDANHTFVNQRAVRDLVRDGQLPLINLYNNFGTPLIGDALTYPYAPHSLTYWVLPDLAAAFVNRVLMMCLTAGALLAYFRRRLSPASAGLATIAAATTPGFLWHFTAHHYQAALFFFVAVLIAQDRFAREASGKSFAALFAFLTTAALSVSINLLLFMLPFLVLHMAFVARRRAQLAAFCALLPAALAWNWTDLAAFASFIQDSVRSRQTYGPEMYGLDLILGLVGPPMHWRHHLDAAATVSLPLLVLGIAGADRRLLGRQALVLGLLPIPLVLLLLGARDFRGAIPFVRSVDISRFLWFSNVFLALSMGMFLDRLKERPLARESAAAPGVLTAGVLLIVLPLRPWRHLDADFLIAPLVLVGAAAGLAWARERGAVASRAALGAAVVLAAVPCTVRIMVAPEKGAEGAFHYFSPPARARFQPEAILEAVPPGSRMAVEASSHLGHDLRGIHRGVLGSQGRSVLLNARMARHLLDQDLIRVDQEPFSYHFKRPWDERKLRDLGIRFIAQSGADPDLVRRGWTLSARDADLHLYENPLPTSLVYFRRPGGDWEPVPPSEIRLRGNGLDVGLQGASEPLELRATFLHWAGWHAVVDGRAQPVASGEDPMLRLRVPAGGRRVRLEYRPFGLADVLLGMAVSLLLAWGTWRGFRRAAGSGPVSRKMILVGD